MRDLVPLRFTRAYFVQAHIVFLIGPIQSDPHPNLFFHFLLFQFLFLLLHRSPETRHNPYSRVLVGQHLSMRLVPGLGRIRKSPRNHHVVGECIRNPALRLLPLELSTFPQAIVKKEKEPKRKKTAATAPLLSSKTPYVVCTIRGVFASYRFVPNSSTSGALNLPSSFSYAAFI